MCWKNFEISGNQVELSTEKATLIKCDQKKWKNYHFWVPTKIVHQKRNGWFFSVGYTSEFEYNVFKNGQGKYNQKEKIDEFSVRGDEILEYLAKV